MRDLRLPRLVLSAPALALLASVVVGVSTGAPAVAAAHSLRLNVREGAVISSSVAPSDPRGLALLAQINKAYTHVPGVKIGLTFNGVSVGSFTEVLRKDTVVAEQFVGSSSAGTTMLVAPEGSPTFAREPGSTCWKALPSKNPQTLTDIGHPTSILGIGTLKGIVVGPPIAGLDGDETLRIVQGATSSFLIINGKTLLIQRVDASTPGKLAEEYISNLTSTPKLLKPGPRC